MAMHKIVGIRWSDSRPEIEREGRVCEADGCETVLSQYNTDPLCAACEQATIRSPAKRWRRPPA
ncbi:MAG: hypothetical protein NVS3B12_23010 [Acidimicrobiales bacterium]